jgi:hypothetical protein
MQLVTPHRIAIANTQYQQHAECSSLLLPLVHVCIFFKHTDVLGSEYDTNWSSERLSADTANVWQLVPVHKVCYMLGSMCCHTFVKRKH